ncbi:MAG TPA: hypothetical protein VKQ36_01700 [Ktedonobacterales bacterium]|nr:hypothetical protein [Ktedonobacterales bacterium]
MALGAISVNCVRLPPLPGVYFLFLLVMTGTYLPPTALLVTTPPRSWAYF